MQWMWIFLAKHNYHLHKYYSPEHNSTEYLLVVSAFDLFLKCVDKAARAFVVTLFYIALANFAFSVAINPKIEFLIRLDF